MKVLEVKKLSKFYSLKHSLNSTLYHSIAESLSKPLKASQTDSFYALKDINFEVNAGEVVGVIGNNGAGKSTLLKLLSEIIEPSSGVIKVRGKISSLLEIGTGFHPELSVVDNIYLNGALLGMKVKDIKGREEEILSFADLNDFVDFPIKNLSSGMRVRLAFAVAIHLSADILLMDEVFAVGDLSFKVKCLTAINAITNSERTILITSHDLREIRSVCNKCLFLDKGKLIASGATEEVIEKYLSYNNSRIESAKDFKTTEVVSGDLGVREFYFTDENSLKLESVTTGKYVQFVINYDTPVRYDDVIVKLFVTSIYGEVLFHLNTRFLHEKMHVLEGPGEIHCIIPRMPLRWGNYFVRLEFMSMGLELYRNEGIPIKVDPGIFYGYETKDQHSGSFYVEHDWVMTVK